jgi:hypothetical protein
MEFTSEQISFMIDSCTHGFINENDFDTKLSLLEILIKLDKNSVKKLPKTELEIFIPNLKLEVKKLENILSLITDNSKEQIEWFDKRDLEPTNKKRKYTRRVEHTRKVWKGRITLISHTIEFLQSINRPATSREIFEYISTKNGWTDLRYRNFSPKFSAAWRRNDNIRLYTFKHKIEDLYYYCLKEWLDYDGELKSDYKIDFENLIPRSPNVRDRSEKTIIISGNRIRVSVVDFVKNNLTEIEKLVPSYYNWDKVESKKQFHKIADKAKEEELYSELTSTDSIWKTFVEIYLHEKGLKREDIAENKMKESTDLEYVDIEKQSVSVEDKEFQKRKEYMERKKGF